MRLQWQKILLMSMLLLITTGYNSFLLGKPAKNVGSPSGKEGVYRSIRIRWKPPQNVGIPGNRGVVSGGTRAGDCSDLSKNKKNEKGTLTALVPEKVIKGETFVGGITNSEHPIFLFYLPYQSEQKYSYEFSLFDIKSGEYIIEKYKQKITPKPGIISITLPNTSSLKPGRQYKGRFSFIFADANTSCNQSSIPVAEGVDFAISLDYKPPNQDLIKRLKTANSEEKITIYTEQGWWYDALASLAELRRKNSKDANIQAAWIELLKAEKLEHLAEFTILP